MKELNGKLEALKKDHGRDQQRSFFFLQEMYEVVSYFKPIDNTDKRIQADLMQYLFPRQILNNLIHLLNVRPQMPKYILVILGDDILGDADLVRLGFKSILTWLFDEIQIAILERFNSLSRKMKQTNKTEVIFMKVLPKPYQCTTQDAKQSRRKINRLFEAELPKYKDIAFSFMNLHEITSDSTDLFYSNGKLNESGQLTFWTAISNKFKIQCEKEETARQKIEVGVNTGDALLDDYIKIQAEKLARGRGAEKQSADHYNQRQQGYFQRRQSFEHNDRYHYYRGNRAVRQSGDNDRYHKV